MSTFTFGGSDKKKKKRQDAVKETGFQFANVYCNSNLPYSFTE